MEWLREKITPGFKEKEDAAFIKWLSNLSPAEKEQILKQTKAPDWFGPIPLINQSSREMVQFIDYYKNLTPQQQYEGLVGPSNTNIHYHNEMVFNPVAGTVSDRDIGARAPSDIK